MTRFLISHLILILLVSASNGQELKLGVVASEFIIQNYPLFEEAEKQLAREVQTWQAERKTWEADMERLQKDIVQREEKLRSSQMYTQQKKEAMQAAIDSLRFDFNKRLTQRSELEQEKFTKRRAELLAEVFEIVNKEIENIGETEDYDIIIDASNGTVVYAKNPDDLNDQLLNLLLNK